MSRRIALSILVTVWAMLIAGGVTAYVTTRAVLLADLDRTLVARAAALPQLAGGPAERPLLAHPDDRFIIRDEVRTVARPTTLASAVGLPPVLSAKFSQLGDGRRVRNVTILAMARGAEPGDPPTPVTVTYSGSAEQFDRLLNRLAIALVVFGLIGGVLAALIAAAVARASLVPLRTTAEVIGTIDERKLDRRIATDQLPPELAPMAHRLNELLGRLEESFAQRRQFLADASHELRTPVAALVTGLEVALLRPRDAADYRQILEQSLDDAQSLRHLVQRLMEQVRSESLGHDQAAEEVDLAQLINRCADIAEPLASERGIRVTRAVETGLRLCSQPNRLRSIVMNLLANAVEYNRPGGAIDVSCSRNGAGVELSVRDTGVGISPEDLPHIFEPFFRADKSRGRDSEHLGLGLALVRSHLLAVGGKCEVESDPGVGTTFRCYLPGCCKAIASV